MNPHLLGKRSEELAKHFLERTGWTVLQTNYRAGRKEIDIIARKSDLVAFVEVKARAGDGFGHPLHAITWRKRREIAYVASVWLERNPAPGCEFRFDVVSVIWRRGKYHVDHVANAWYIEVR